MAVVVAVVVAVAVIVPVIVAALVSGNDTVGVIHAVSDDATGGLERPIARACSIFRSSTYTSARSSSLPWHIAYVNGYAILNAARGLGRSTAPRRPVGSAEYR